ncbi:transcriptional regulator [Alteromonas sp. KUL156]|nr:transcriptional regulator [Alteromonas sp. KUL154]GFD98119.1 transcriptional regulator [Alteromonas sp. KUL156]
MANTETRDVVLVCGEVIKAYRKKIDVSQEELAYRANLDRTFVSRVERGLRQPTIKSLLQIAQALEISASELVGKIEEQI